MSDPEKKPFWKRFAARAGAITGTTGIFGRICSLGTPFRKAYEENRQRLQENLETEDEARDFSRLLSLWDIESEERLLAYLKNKRLTLCLGLLLMLFSGLGMLFQRSGFSGYLGGMACMSVCLFGFLLALTSAWRISVLKKGKFTPFAEWIMPWKK